MAFRKKEKNGNMGISDTPPVRSERNREPETVRRGGGSSVIGRGLKIDGEITGDNELMIEGKVQGKIRISGSVVVSQTGEVLADVFGHEVTVLGKVTGNIDAKNRVILKPSALMTGNITCPSFIVNEGASFEGQIHMENPVAKENQAKSQPQPQNQGNSGPKNDKN